MATRMRTALLLAPHNLKGNNLCDALRQQPELHTTPQARGCTCRGKGLTLRIEVVRSAAEALDLLRQEYYNLLIVDCRNPGGGDHEVAAREGEVNGFLEALRREPDRERRYPFRRIVALVGDADPSRADRVIFAMGERHVGACVRDRSFTHAHTPEQQEQARRRFVAELWDLCRRTLTEKRRGKRAICAAGGGLSGLYYELGVLKCLHDASDLDVGTFDMYFGISAGALVTAGLATGFTIDELIAKFGGLDRGWPYRLRLEWRHLNLAEVPRRLLLAQKALLEYVSRLARNEDELSVAAILGTYGNLLGPIFDNRPLEEGVRRLLSSPGHSNDFRQLPRPLYIGATDQDRREHVLFGDVGWDDVPISKAIQASTAMHPFFPSVEIKGRYFTDGIVTRTSNLRAAIDKGADLIIVVDPFVPLITDRPGSNARMGNMWVMEQDYKTMSFTRYEQARNEILRRSSKISVYTFVPSNRMRHLMSNQNPFVARNFHAIVCQAYSSTFRRLKVLEYKLAGELASHGLTFDLGPVAAKVAALSAAPRPDAALLLGTARAGSGRADVA
ncbi:MAG: patatin-like phospholipase family protein [Acidobacteriota bacterium]